jgi:hypothetical protein
MNGLCQVLISAHDFNVSRRILLQVSKEIELGVNTVNFLLSAVRGNSINIKNV